MVVKTKITAAEKRGGGRGRVVVEEETMCNNNSSGGGLMRKGPWTEQEDAQLVWFVRLLGERRWDFLAKVSGLKRTGKSCRLRWVNYLHPGLKRGRITPDEELLIVQLYAQWGSRWSRIARKLPGRTDNEIKNYWRTHTRKKAQEEKKKKKRAAAPASSSSSSSSMSTRTTTSCSASLNNGTTATSSTSAVTTGAPQESTSGDEAEEATTAASQHQHQQQPQPQEQEHYYSMDQLWNEIAAAEAAATSYAEGWDSAGHVVAAEPAASMPSPVWEFCADYSLWRIDDEEYYKRCSMLHDAYHLSY